MENETQLKKLYFRAWHRGTREADFMIGGFLDCYGKTWDEAQIAWFDALLKEDDVDIMAWAIGTQEVPEAFAGDMMAAMQKLDYIEMPK